MTETESAILAHARRCAPAESCGFVVRAPEGERYFPCVNISGEPEDYFRMAPEDWLQAEDIKGNLAGRCAVCMVFSLNIHCEETGNAESFYITGKPAVYILSLKIARACLAVECISIFLCDTHGILDRLYGGIPKPEGIVIEISHQSDLFNRRNLQR